MSAVSLIKYLHLAYFAKPAADRVVFRSIRKIRAGHLVAIGLSNGELARKMILLARNDTTRPKVCFTGIDVFEMRPDPGDCVTLKQAHRTLGSLGARTQLVPGDPFTALSRHANSLLDTDLVVIRADQLGEAMDRAWFYLPRMLHDRSLVLVEKAGHDGQDATYEVLDRATVQRRAAVAMPLRKAA